MLSATLSHDGHRLRMNRCSIWVLAVDSPKVVDDKSVLVAKQAVERLKGVMQVRRRCIDMRESVARGEWAMAVQAECSGRLTKCRSWCVGSMHSSIP